MTEEQRKQQLAEQIAKAQGKNDPSREGVSLEVELPPELVKVADEAVNFYAPLLQQYFVQETLNKAFGGGIMEQNKSFLGALNFKKPLLALPSK